MSFSMMRRLATWSVVLLVGAVAVVAIVAAVVNNDSPSSASAVATNSTADVSLCNSKQLELSIRASGFAAHVVGVRLSSGTEPCDVGELQITATVVDGNGDRAATTVAPPRDFIGPIHSGEELIASFDYTMRCRQKERGPFTATVTAEGEIGSVRATAPVAFRRDPFTQSAC